MVEEKLKYITSIKIKINELSYKQKGSSELEKNKWSFSTYDVPRIT